VSTWRRRPIGANPLQNDLVDLQIFTLDGKAA
jgi:hypothetical protein